jgi:hypothetical protein
MQQTCRPISGLTNCIHQRRTYSGVTTMHAKFLLLPITMLSACATTDVSTFQAPDGTTVKSVKCSSDAAKCFALASQSCPDRGTYRVLSSQSNAGGLLADVIPGPVTWYSMTYACGPSDGKMPEFKFVGQQYTPPPPPTQVTIKPRPTTTNCTKIGETVTCNTY